MRLPLFLDIICLMLIGFKIAGYITLSWWWVLLPALWPLYLTVGALCGVGMVAMLATLLTGVVAGVESVRAKRRVAYTTWR